MKMAEALMAKLDEILKSILEEKGVQEYIILNSDGIVIRSTLDAATAKRYAGFIQPLVMKAWTTIQEIDPENDLTFVRLGSKKDEIMIALDNNYMLMVVQIPSY